ncbi:Unknown protein sequence [Pseudomonas amygdali pv. lachrymans]|nr:Unknown protein sequence [Pseudomonas amygdali pv. lachrymans]
MVFTLKSVADASISALGSLFAFYELKEHRIKFINQTGHGRMGVAADLNDNLLQWVGVIDPALTRP